VEEFIEKPSPELARDLALRGGLWNTFIVAADAKELLTLFRRRCGSVVQRLEHALATGGLTELYAQLPTLDFSRDILEGEEASLQVLRVPECGWSDLGTPERVAEVLRETRTRPMGLPGYRGALMSLAAQHAQLAVAAGWSGRLHR
jgi:mannose-1-phosphate guanylyltransferase